MADQPIRVLVIGAGIAGLTAALRLAERGFAVDVLEQRVFVGGKLGAHRHVVQSRLWRDVRRAAGLTQANDSVAALEACIMTPQTQDWVVKWIDDYLTTRRSLLARKPPTIDEALFSGPLDIAPIEARHGAEKAWRIVRKAGTATPALCFNLSVYRRGDQSLRVELADDAYHEHCYHLYLNWYRNFWELMRDIGREKTQHFRPMNTLTHLSSGPGLPTQRMHVLSGVSSVATAADNLLSGAETIPDMLLWFYSSNDLVSHPLNTARYLDRSSVHGFMSSRWYASERGAQFHEHVLSKAFAVPTYYSSAYAYRRYLEYSLTQPEPMLWVLEENCYDGIFAPLVRALTDTQRCRLRLGISVTGLEYANKADGAPPSENILYPEDLLISGIKFKFAGARGFAQFSDDEQPEQYADSPEQRYDVTPDYVIVAIPPAALAELLNAPNGNGSAIRSVLPSLATVRKLQSGVIASLDLYFTRELPGLPGGHVVLRDSEYALSFIDNSGLWPRPSGDTGRCTYLNVVANDFYKIQGMQPDQAIRIIIDDLKQFVDFDDDDIDFGKTYLQLNDRDPLFLNEVGSEPWRPQTKTEIDNLFIAGDFTDNEIGIVSVEGAVLSGLCAARAVQAQARVDGRHRLAYDAPELREIPVLLPETYPMVNAHVAKLMLTGHTAAAKAWSRAIELTQHPERALSTDQIAADYERMLSAPAAFAADLARLATSTAQWLSELPYGDQ